MTFWVTPFGRPDYDCRTAGLLLFGTAACAEEDGPVMQEAITELTERRKAWRDVEDLIGRINRKLRGWCNYLPLGTVSKAYRNIGQPHSLPGASVVVCEVQGAGSGKEAIH